MTLDELREHFKKQFREAIDEQGNDEKVQVAFASGALLVLSALIVKDGPSIPMQVRVMHTALREVGDERSWGIDSRKGGG